MKYLILFIQTKILLGTIVDQYPKPYTRVKMGRTVKLKIAQPERSVPGFPKLLVSPVEANLS
ncbi:MAG: hypothetical protein CM1200mP10_26090 [Candidatus Neomarinimicrobiota bacterium]|nr:MAG: hypothetical protein CM1200mP10_26090 [Candidatus Neomarinimicrobiota bacterium]